MLQYRSVVSTVGCLSVEGFSPSPRNGGGEKQWLTISTDFSKSELPVHFQLESSSQVEARKKAAMSTNTTDSVAVIGIVRFLGGTFPSSGCRLPALFGWASTLSLSRLVVHVITVVPHRLVTHSCLQHRISSSQPP